MTSIVSNASTYYAVIFTSQRKADDAEGYASMAERMLKLAREQDGYLGVDSARGSDGQGITVSYWRDLESIRNWKANVEHRAAQAAGREKWYASYQLRICRVEMEYSFDAET